MTLGPPLDPERLPPALGRCAVRLDDGAAREAWLASTAPHGRLRALGHRLLRRVATDFDVNAWLGVHPVFLLGEAGWAAMAGGGGRLLDVGAGGGDVTVHARPLFDDVLTTEVSAPMARRARRRGLRCLEVDLATRDLGERFDTVALLNVLDRCARPRALLAAARDHLAPGGALVVSLPLPARPHVDVGGHTVDPDEPLGGRGEGWEEALVDLAASTLRPAGLEVARLARVPYLARGGPAHPLHVLDAAVVTCRVAAAG